MDRNGNGRLDNHQAGQGAGPLPCLSGGENANTTGGSNDRITASDVMDLVSEMTRTSAEIYELIADLSGSLTELPQESFLGINSPFRWHVATLMEIIKTTQRSEIRVQILESKASNTQPSFLDPLLVDCRSALEAFNDAGKNLTSIIAWDRSTSPRVTVAETLILAMKHMDTCLGKIAGLPAAGMAVSHQCLSENVQDLQHRAGRLVS